MINTKYDWIISDRVLGVFITIIAVLGWATIETMLWLVRHFSLGGHDVTSSKKLLTSGDN